MNSPKNKFRIEITFNKPLIGIGSVVSYTANSVEQLDAYVKAMNCKKCHVVIQENKENYPKFKWVTINSYDIK